MPRYRDVWLEIPKKDRAGYPTHVQQQLDQRVAELLEDPRAGASFFPGLQRDFWITSFGLNDEGTIEYSVREEPIPTVGIRRVYYMDDL